MFSSLLLINPIPPIMRSFHTFILLLLLSVAATAQTTIFDFEGEAPTFEDFGTPSALTTFVDNPDSQDPNTSPTVAQHDVPANASFPGVKFTQAIDLSTDKGFRLQVWSPITNAPILLKFEDGTIADIERVATFTGAAGTWQELEFDFSDEGDVSFGFVVLFMNFNVAGSEDLTFYFDNLIQEDIGGGNGGMGDGAQMDLPVTFDDGTVDYGLDDFEGNASMFALNPDDATDTVAASIKMVGSAPFAGTTLNSTSGGPQGFASRINFTDDETVITVNVWVPNAGTPVRLKVENANDPTISVETQTNTTVGGAWETLEFDFANEATGTAALNLNSFYNKLSIFFNFGTEGADNTYLWDDVIFTGEGGGGGGDDDEPMVAAPTPTRDAANVISMFSNAYTDVPVDTWRTDWSGESVVFSDIQIEGNDTKKYEGLTFVGIETVGTPIDLEAAEMTHLHVDVWTPNMDSLRIKLVDFLGDGFEGPNGITEDELTFATAQNTWVGLDIPLDDFMMMTGQSDINQFLFVGVPAGTLYVDNIYFYKSDPDATNTPLTGILEVYPNPTTERVNITAPTRMETISLYGMSGRLLGQWTVNAEQYNLDMSNLAPGMYVALVTTADGPLTVKLVKE